MHEICLTPQEIVAELNKHVVGQEEAKRAVAIALRNRWRRMQLPKELREEVTPKNILMIGPTGVGKTEIARRLARLAGAPFIKVEATKYTEVGYVGRDVESMIRDLVEVAVKQAKEIALVDVAEKAQEATETRILDALLTPPRTVRRGASSTTTEEETPMIENQFSTRSLFREQLRAGALDDKEIEIEVMATSIGVEIMAPPGMEEMTSQLTSLFQSMGSDRSKMRKMRIKEARRVLQEEESVKLINEEELKATALEKVEQNGIVFIDEIDKVTRRSGNNGQSGGEVSREGVQRDLLPLIEGCTVSTKYGMVKTDHILFIASGAFHLTKPSDLIPELQGRLPIRVELSALSADDFVRILTEPNASLTEQYTALMATESVTLVFMPEGVKRIAEIAYQVNETAENIGARRLHTVMERLQEEISFSATTLRGQVIHIDAAYVDERLASLAKNQDLSQYIL